MDAFFDARGIAQGALSETASSRGRLAATEVSNG